jgi:hypothetical protein
MIENSDSKDYGKYVTPMFSYTCKEMPMTRQMSRWISVFVWRLGWMHGRGLQKLADRNLLTLFRYVYL